MSRKDQMNELPWIERRPIKEPRPKVMFKTKNPVVVPKAMAGNAQYELRPMNEQGVITK